MASRNSSSSLKLQALVTILYRCRVMSGGSWRGYHYQSLRHNVPPPYNKLGCSVSVDQGLSCSSRAYSQSKLGMEKDHKEQAQPELAPTKFGFFNWAKWLLGSVLSLLLPFWKSNRDNLLILEGKAEMVVKDVKEVAEVIEKVATTTDEVLKEVENQLPDNCKLKEAAQVMEHISTVAAQDARLLENIIHKVGEVKQDLEELETIVEPNVEKIIQKEHPQVKSRNHTL
ncbi:hypothetical protein ACJIZ3_001180 [Penstemon smallii]|uniref:Uncharacterized protein n=1 Tax=Penstemon smallii TaxID=265156 RepID=A0ABD3U3Y9_9LAMI